jgi:cell division protein FtsZ
MPQPRPQAQPAHPAAASAPAVGGAQRAGAQDAGITIQPFDPGPLHYAAAEVDADRPAPAEPEPPVADEPYIPPPAETPPARIPRVEDFPPVAQRQMEARRGAEIASAAEDRGPLSLLRRLASVGLGRREDDQVGAGAAARPQQPQPGPAPRVEPRPPARPAAQQLPPQPRAPQPPRQTQQQEPLYRPPQGDLDQHGRPLPRDARLQDDELEIPAFLRRQAN